MLFSTKIVTVPKPPPTLTERLRFAGRMVFNYWIAPLLLGFILIGLIWIYSLIFR